MQQVSSLIVAKHNPATVLHATRTSVAGVVSYLIARLLHFPEAHWALISTLIVMQSTLGAALPVSLQRFAGTALGAAVGALMVTLMGGSFWTFGLAVFLVGLLCAFMRVERSAYRYASITLAIVMLIERSASVWSIAIHRFFEVSLGIAVGLIVSAVWQEPESKNDPSRPAMSEPLQTKA